MAKIKDPRANISEIDNLIRANNLSEATDKLNKLAAAKPSRDVQLDLARLARRAGNPSLALRTLHPINETDEEKVEYAAALVGMGAFDEARDYLSAIPADKMPEKLFVQSLLSFETWNVKEAAQSLSSYIKSGRTEGHQKVSAKLLLAKAFIYQKEHSDAENLLNELRESNQGNDNALAFQNALELSTQLAVAQEKWDQAQNLVGKLNDFSQRLWKAIVQVRRSNGSPESLALLKESKKEAHLKKQWDAVRLCDLAEGIALRDEKLLAHLYFGTPFQGFRKHLEAEFGRTLALPSEYFWQPRGAKGVGVTFDLFKGTLDNGKASLKVGQTLHRLLVCLCSDFYRPLRIATIHSEIFPKAPYHPASSPTRVHQVIKRLRQWMESEQVPLMLESEVGVYQLVGTGPCRVRISETNGSKDQAQLVYQKIQDCFGEKPFSSAQVATAFNLSTRSARRILSRLVSTGLLESFGNGTSTRYCKPRMKAAA